MKLGAYYWDGWYAKIPHWTDRLMNEFAEREPIWGWLGNTVENMELQIDIAADHGIKYFAFDWYYPPRAMNNAVDRFLAAKNCDRMEFCLLVANHQGAYIERDKWEDACDHFMPYLTHKNALKVDGKPVIIFFSSGDLHRCLGGAEETNKCLDYLRDLCKKAGLPGCYVLGCGGPARDARGDVDLTPEKWEGVCAFLDSLGLDAVTGYNYHRGAIVEGDKKTYIYAYEDLARDHEVSWDAFAKHLKKTKYMPLVIGGWDCRPWETLWEGQTVPHGRSCYSPDRTPATLYQHTKNAAEWIKANKGKTVDDLAIVYAWNENGEGGFIEPTKGDNGRILKGIQKALEDTAD